MHYPRQSHVLLIGHRLYPRSCIIIVMAIVLVRGGLCLSSDAVRTLVLYATRTVFSYCTVFMDSIIMYSLDSKPFFLMWRFMVLSQLLSGAAMVWRWSAYIHLRLVWGQVCGSCNRCR